MTHEQWTTVDHYINDLFAPPDPALDATLRTSTAAGLPQINVAPNQGKLLHLLANSTRLAPRSTSSHSHSHNEFASCFPTGPISSS